MLKFFFFSCSELKIEQAWPCMPTSSDTRNVEMDPQAALEISQKIQDAGQTVVGW
jgi:hypothetical protein